MNATLVILAAGMGSRYGGLKQLDPVGPNGETIIDFSVYDAIRAGFNKVVFVIRKSFKDEFEEKISNKYKGKIEIEHCFQSTDKLPFGCKINPEREKPLGTGHAAWCAKEALNENFAVINADDFYGCGAFQILADYLKTMDKNDISHQVMVVFSLSNTLSENGFVSRGICEVDEKGFLVSITERTNIGLKNDGTAFYKQNDKEYPISLNSVVSMNMMGFSLATMEYFEKDLVDFLKENNDNLKAEFYLPTVMSNLVKNKLSEVKVVQTTEKWFGITYSEDKQSVVEAISELIELGVYPKKLF